MWVVDECRPGGLYVSLEMITRHWLFRLFQRLVDGSQLTSNLRSQFIHQAIDVPWFTADS